MSTVAIVVACIAVAAVVIAFTFKSHAWYERDLSILRKENEELRLTVQTLRCESSSLDLDLERALSDVVALRERAVSAETKLDEECATVAMPEISNVELKIERPKESKQPSKVIDDYEVSVQTQDSTPSVGKTQKTIVLEYVLSNPSEEHTSASVAKALSFRSKSVGTYLNNLVREHKIARVGEGSFRAIVAEKNPASPKLETNDDEPIVSPLLSRSTLRTIGKRNTTDKTAKVPMRVHILEYINARPYPFIHTAFTLGEAFKGAFAHHSIVARLHDLHRENFVDKVADGQYCAARSETERYERGEQEA